MRKIDISQVNFAEFVRPGDTVIWGQACGEPISLTEAILAQRARIGKFNVFLGSCFSSSISPDQADYVRFTGIGGVGSNRRLTSASVMEILPNHISAIDRYVASGILPADVVLIQVGLPNERGEFSCGLISDYIRTAVDKARIVIAETSSQVPQTNCERPLTAADIDILVETDRKPVELASGTYGEREKSIAGFAAPFIPERATLQMGNGAIPEAIMATLTSHRGLGIHSGMVGDSVAELIKSGVVTNEYKEVDTGYAVTGCLMGTRKLFDFAADNPQIRMCSVSRTHGPDSLAKLGRFVSINSALEVDLTGQVNAEAAGKDYVGAVGGQIDYVRAASVSPGGCSIIALPATAKGGAVSKIVSRLSGPVTTARSDTGVVVTEFGAADLRGKSLQQRARALISIADPAHREQLEREAGELFGRAV